MNEKYQQNKNFMIITEYVLFTYTLRTEGRQKCRICTSSLKQMNSIQHLAQQNMMNQ